MIMIQESIPLLLGNGTVHAQGEKICKISHIYGGETVCTTEPNWGCNSSKCCVLVISTCQIYNMNLKMIVYIILFMSKCKESVGTRCDRNQEEASACENCENFITFT